MRHVELPDASENARAAHQQPALAHSTTINQRGRVARDEHEYLGGVAEAEITDRERIDNVGGDVVDEDQPKRQAAKEIEPKVALRGDRRNHW